MDSSLQQDRLSLQRLLCIDQKDLKLLVFLKTCHMDVFQSLVEMWGVEPQSLKFKIYRHSQNLLVNWPTNKPPHIMRILTLNRNKLTKNATLDKKAVAAPRLCC